MKNELLESAYSKLIAQNVNLIKTGYTALDETLSFCNYSSIITFCGSLNHEFFLNLVRNFSIQNKKCLYFFDAFKHERFLMELMTLNKEFNNDLNASKNEIKNWNIVLKDNKFTNINDFKTILEEEKPNYIFIDNLKQFEIKSLNKDDFIWTLKTIIKEYNSIVFIKSGDVLLENIDIDEVNVSSLKTHSDVIIATTIKTEDNYSFWVLKNSKLDYNVFSLKYEYQKYLFRDIINCSGD